MFDATGGFLLRILSAPSSASLSPLQEPGDGGGLGSADDPKCRLHAARLLCNLVTDNEEAARKLLTSSAVDRSSLERSGTGRELTEQQNQRLHASHRRDSSEAPAAPALTGEHGLQGTAARWVDLVVRNSGRRDVLAAIVATLHNAVAAAAGPRGVSRLCALTPASSPAAGSLTDWGGEPQGGAGRGSATLALQLSRDTLLLNALLRQLVPVQSIAPFLASTSPPESWSAENDGGGPLDDAGEWIVLLLQGLVRRGHLRTLYTAISGSAGKEEEEERIRRAGDKRFGPYCALPEHVVLLFCIQQRLLARSPRDDSSALLELCDVPSKAIETVLFLADVYSDLSAIDGHPERSRQSLLFMERLSVMLRILELVADLLQHDASPNDLDRQTREALGIHSSFVPRLSSDLAALVDRYFPAGRTSTVQPQPPAGSSELEREASAAPSVRSASDNPTYQSGDSRLVIPPQDQEWLTSLVRLLGNLCYRCHENQDLMRTILVPPSPSSSKEAEPGASVGSTATSRNVLHVLLTSTSLAPYCFTLREWAVVAVRNALEGNEENQAVLAELQAQQSVSTAALADMGIRIDLDAATGTARVVPTDRTSHGSANSIS
jgi:hypothetical protein